MSRGYAIAVFLHIVGALGLFRRARPRVGSLYNLRRVPTPARPPRSGQAVEARWRSWEALGLSPILATGLYMTTTAGAARGGSRRPERPRAHRRSGGALSGRRSRRHRATVAARPARSSGPLRQHCNARCSCSRMESGRPFGLGVVYVMAIKPGAAGRVTAMGVALVLGASRRLPRLEPRPAVRLAVPDLEGRAAAPRRAFWRRPALVGTTVDERIAASRSAARDAARDVPFTPAACTWGVELASHPLGVEPRSRAYRTSSSSRGALLDAGTRDRAIPELPLPAAAYGGPPPRAGRAGCSSLTEKCRNNEPHLPFTRAAPASALVKAAAATGTRNRRNPRASRGQFADPKGVVRAADGRSEQRQSATPAIRQAP